MRLRLILGPATRYDCGMAHELDNITAQTECPVCGRALTIPYKTLRLERVIECQGCGETIRPIDDTPIGRVQKLIDEAGG